MAEEIKETNTNEGEAKTFTQDDLNRIVADRVRRESEKYADYEDLKKKVSEIEEAKTGAKNEKDRADALQAELDAIKSENATRQMKETISKETGVPMELIIGDTEDACRAHAAAIREYSKVKSYPSVQDSGESKAPSVTKADILAIKSEKARLKAIQEHIDLFS